MQEREGCDSGLLIQLPRMKKGRKEVLREFQRRLMKCSLPFRKPSETAAEPAAELFGSEV